MEGGKSANSKVYNLFVKLLDGNTLTLRFPTPIVDAKSIKDRVFEVTKIPNQQQRLITGVHQLIDDKSVISCSADADEMFPTVHILLRLAGGKGGFGSLLRGAAYKAGQKKTNNFDACRDMSGRRLRHVNAEKRFEEWKAEEAERKLEKAAEEFLKKQAKKGKKGVGDGETQKYVAKYREESERCVAEVAESVKEALRSVNGKRKSSETAKDGVDAKKLKIWMGKRKLNESDSDDSDEDESDGEDENEKSVVLNSGTDSDTNKGAEGSQGSVTGRKLELDGESSGAGSCESASEEEETILDGKLLCAEESDVVEPVRCDEKMTEDPDRPCSESVISEINAEEPGMQACNGAASEKLDAMASQASEILISENVADASKSNEMENDKSQEQEASDHEEILTSASVPEVEEPLNFDAYNSAKELETLGMERLKSELQARGLKCGGTLQERAARLFLLKSTPLDKLPKKLLAKK